LVGWQLSTSLRTDLALDALEMGPVDPGARRQRHHRCDRALRQRRAVPRRSLTSNASPKRARSPPSDPPGDSCDNALAEAFNSLFKAEMVGNKGPWKSIDDLEIAVAEYVEWFNHRRLHGEIGLISSVEHEDNNYRQHPYDE
jgi:putative transposase